MPEFRITTPGGTYKVEAPDEATAVKELQTHRQTELNQAKLAEEKTIPAWQIPFTAAKDAMIVGGDRATFGLGAKAVKSLFGGEPEMEVEARANRMGLAGNALEAAMMAKFLPSLAGKAITSVGGGPLARWLTGTAAATAEGGAYGGAQAAGHDQPVVGGAAVGAAGGGLGHQVGILANKAGNLIRGVDNSVPQGIRSKITVLPKNASAADKVTVADNLAKAEARTSDKPLAYQSKVKENINDLLISEPKSFTPGQRSLMENVVKDEPGTKFSRVLGGMLTNPMTVAAATSGGWLSGIPGASILAPAASYGGGRALQSVSQGGTKEAMDDLLRAMRGKQKVPETLTPEQQMQMMKAIRELAVTQLTPDDL